MGEFFELRRLGGLAAELNCSLEFLLAQSADQMDRLLIVFDAWQDWQDWQIQQAENHDGSPDHAGI